MFKINEEIISRRLSGDFSPNGVSFQISGESEPRAISKAKLSTDGATLTGTTTEIVPVEGGAVEYRFAWEAKRYVGGED